MRTSLSSRPPSPIEQNVPSSTSVHPSQQDLSSKGAGVAQGKSSSPAETAGERSIPPGTPHPGIRQYIRNKASSRNLKESDPDSTRSAEGHLAPPDASQPGLGAKIRKTLSIQGLNKASESAGASPEDHLALPDASQAKSLGLKLKKSFSRLNLRGSTESPPKLETKDIEAIKNDFYKKVPVNLHDVYQTISGSDGLLKRMSKDEDGEMRGINYQQILKNVRQMNLSAATLLTTAAVNAAYKEVYLTAPPSFESQSHYLNGIKKIEKKGGSAEQIESEKAKFTEECSETYQKTLAQFQKDVNAFREEAKKPYMSPLREVHTDFLYTLKKELFPRKGFDEERPTPEG